MTESRVCVCGHAGDWHSHKGIGGCEHDRSCGCKSFMVQNRPIDVKRIQSAIDRLDHECGVEKDKHVEWCDKRGIEPGAIIALAEKFNAAIVNGGSGQRPAETAIMYAFQVGVLIGEERTEEQP